MKLDRSPTRGRAFTRLDLLLLLCTLALLAAVGTPAWGNAARGSRTLVCMDNLRRLAATWALYADDQNGRLPLNLSGDATPSGGTVGWASGWLDWTTSSVNTNSALLTNPSSSTFARLGLRDASVYRCPADTYLSPTQLSRGWLARSRSYSMNYFAGPGSSAAGSLFPGYITYTRLSDLRELPPARLFVFAEEHPDSLNDTALVTNPGTPMWVDLPGSFHAQSAWFSFADGHLELHRWQSTRTLPPVTYRIWISIPTPPNDPDLTWVKERATERR